MATTVSDLSVQNVSMRAQNRNIARFTESDVDAAMTGHAVGWLRQYRGSFDFLVQMQDQSLRRFLSPRQIAGVLNCMLAESRRQNAAAQPAPAPSAPPVATTAPAAPVATTAKIVRKVRDGRFTLTSDVAARITLRLSTPDWGDFPEGTQVAAYLSGPDNDSMYTGFAFVKGERFSMWRKFAGNARLADALRVLLTSDDATSFGKAYARESGNCYVCGRTLTTPESIDAGIGPVCASRES